MGPPSPLMHTPTSVYRGCLDAVPSICFLRVLVVSHLAARANDARELLEEYRATGSAYGLLTHRWLYLCVPLPLWG